MLQRSQPWFISDIQGKLPFYCGVAHSFTGIESPTDGDGWHIYILTAFAVGRLSRVPGDTLCRPRLKWNGLRQEDSHAITCTVCRDKALRLLC